MTQEHKFSGAFTLSGTTPHLTATTTPQVVVESPDSWIDAPLERDEVTFAQVDSVVPSQLPPCPSKIARG